jgi:hypothetical protein
MAKKIFKRVIGIFAAVCLVLPILNIKIFAEDYEFGVDLRDLRDMTNNTDYSAVPIYLTGVHSDTWLQLWFEAEAINVTWQSTVADNADVQIFASASTQNGPFDNLNFLMTGGTMKSFEVSASFFQGDYCTITIGGNAHILGDLTIADGAFVTIQDNAIIDGEIIAAEVSYVDNRTPPAPEPVIPPPPSTPEPTPDYSSPSYSGPATPEIVKPVVGEVLQVESVPVLTSEIPPETYVPPKVVIADDTPVVIDGEEYSGTVKIAGVDSDKPQEIPKEVIIDGERYAVGETVYIVGTEEKKVEANADTGFSYVFTAVENSDAPVKFSAEGLPEGLLISEDGVITTKTLPAPVGTFTIKITADNGADTHTYEMTIEIKEGGLSDEELLAALTANDNPELAPQVLSLPGDEAEDETGSSDSDIPTLWTNGEVKLHYEPEIDDFYAIFLDGQLLTPEEDYRLEEGSTVIILTEQTISPLPNGDHVVTTMFHENSEVGLDTVINDVGSSSFVFRFGDEKSDNKRINISGDGVEGSVSFDDKNTKDTPITTLSANTEAIETRAKNLSNATGREIIAAFETKQHGGFGGKTATFAVSAKSLNISLKNGKTVYVAVYDSKTGKTYQNKGEVKDGMIVFKTKHSGVFMIALEKF